MHSYSAWSVTKEATCVNAGTQSRQCSKCGYLDVQSIIAYGHTEVIDNSIQATCMSTGLTEGVHCSTCNATISKQEIIPALGHSEIIDEGIAATCTETGLTQGSHCSVCGSVVVEQQDIPAKGHLYITKVIEEASCIKEGKKENTCSICGETTTEIYTLQVYSADEIYEQVKNSVGEIVTYDDYGKEVSLGTGFVYSTDGKIVTNYHVIDGASSAKVKIEGKEYDVQYVLAYDAAIDLAVLQISAVDLQELRVCKEDVQTGKTVYAFGSSQGMTATFSQGIVTYAKREIGSVVYVQHDAAISNGNSGGPLLNQYCEIIGINTMTIQDSQNLNFAIASVELDNLIYGTPLTLPEFCEKECNLFKKMKDYIVNEGELDEEGYYWKVVGETYSENYSEQYIRYAEYYPEDNEIQLSLVLNKQNMFTLYFTDVTGIYTWSYMDVEDNYMIGLLNATTFDETTLELGYIDTNVGAEWVSDAQSLSAAMAKFLVRCIDYDFYNVGITATGLMFINY